MLISSTLILVFITTVLFGALMSPIVKYFSEGTEVRKSSLDESFIGEELRNYSLQGFDGETLNISNFGDLDTFTNNNPRNYNMNNNKIHGLWAKLDKKILGPIFVDDWSTARQEHSQIAKEIMQIFDNHEKNKKKVKELKKFNKNNEIS